MGDTLFGRERSGTPVETRAATGEMAEFFRNLMNSQVGGSPILGRSAIDSAADITSGFRSSMEPVRQRETDRQVGGLREMFGTAGGRFGSTIARGEGEMREGLSTGFEREELGAMLSILPAILQAENQRLATAAGFLQPGAPIWQEGIAGDLLTAGGMAAGAFFPPAGAAAAASQFRPAPRQEFRPPQFISGAPGLRR